MFRLHEIVIGQNFIRDTFRNGMEGEIIEGLNEYNLRCTQTHKLIGNRMAYGIQWADGDKTWQTPKYLRKLPPKDTKTEWGGVFVPKELVHE